MLEVLSHCMEHMGQDQLRILQLLNPSAEQLLQTGKHQDICPEAILRAIRQLIPQREECESG